MNEQHRPLAWDQRSRRLFRGFMVLTGLGLIVPGLIYLSSLSDTVKATGQVLGSSVAPFITWATVVALLAGGLSFILGRFVRIGSVMAAAALICGSLIHYAWSKMMMRRMDLVPDGISPEQQHLLQDTVLFAANAQIPHIVKNVILIGVCALFFFLAPDVCSSTTARRRP